MCLVTKPIKKDDSAIINLINFVLVTFKDGQRSGRPVDVDDDDNEIKTIIDVDRYSTIREIA